MALMLSLKIPCLISIFLRKRLSIAAARSESITVPPEIGLTTWSPSDVLPSNLFASFPTALISLDLTEPATAIKLGSLKTKPSPSL